jgi:hypothetical protein
LPVIVVVTAIVVVIAVGTVSACRGSGPDGGSAVAPTRAIIAAITRIARDGTAGATRYRTARDRATRYRVRWPSNTAGMYGTAAEATGVKPSAAAEAATSATASVGVIGNECCGNQNES